jgi:hypothetical protein
VVDYMRIEGWVRKRFALSPFLVFVLAPFLISACFLLMLVFIYGLVRLLVFIGLSSLVLPVWGIGFLAALPLGFLMAVRIGRFLVGISVHERNV